MAFASTSYSRKVAQGFAGRDVSLSDVASVLFRVPIVPACPFACWRTHSRVDANRSKDDHFQYIPVLLVGDPVQDFERRGRRRHVDVSFPSFARLISFVWTLVHVLWRCCRR